MRPQSPFVFELPPDYRVGRHPDLVTYLHTCSRFLVCPQVCSATGFTTVGLIRDAGVKSADCYFDFRSAVTPAEAAGIADACRVHLAGGFTLSPYAGWDPAAIRAAVKEACPSAELILSLDPAAASDDWPRAARSVESRQDYVERVCGEAAAAKWSGAIVPYTDVEWASGLKIWSRAPALGGAGRWSYYRPTAQELYDAGVDHPIVSKKFSGCRDDDSAVRYLEMAIEAMPDED